MIANKKIKIKILFNAAPVKTKNKKQQNITKAKHQPPPSPLQKTNNPTLNKQLSPNTHKKQQN